MVPTASAVTPASRFATVNGVRIHYLDWGNAGARPLILLHGIARVAHCFDHLAQHFARTHHVLAIDMRGHGESEWHAGGAYLVEDYTSDIEALLEQMDLRDCVLWGASTGGRVVQMIAGRHPERVSAVIVEDVGPERPQSISNRRGARMAKEEAGWASIDELVVQLRADFPRTAESVLRHFALKGAKARADGRMVWKRDPAILKGFIATELWDTVRRIKAPIVYILGGASSIVPPQAQIELQQRLPQSLVVTLAGLGHYPSDEAPEAFLAVVDQFLETVPR